MKKLDTKSNEELVSMQAQALLNPNGLVYEVDFPFLEDQFVPPEFIRGGWEVNEHGILTGVFVQNQDFREVRNACRLPREYMLQMEAERFSNNFAYAKQWFMEIDPKFDHYFPDIPKEGYTGRWYIDENGKFNGWFRPNPNYTGDLKT
jgi:hypothetical protein